MSVSKIQVLLPSLRTKDNGMFNIIKIIVLTLIFSVSSQAALYENWNSGEPNNSGILGEDCVSISASTGYWNDRGCAILAPASNGLHYACYDGATWAYTRLKSDLNNGSAHAYCQELGNKFYFAAPFNNYENKRLQKVLQAGGISSAWLNIGDWISGEGNWVANGTNSTAVAPPYITRWAGDDENNFDEPDNGGSSGNQDCVVLDKDGFWYDTECDAGVYRFLCADPGSSWHLSTVTSNNSDLYSGERACRATNILYSFKTAESDPEYDGTRAAILSSVGNNELVWVNVNDRLEEGNFQANQNRYFWNDNEPNGYSNGSEECVVKNSNSTEYGWNDLTCSGATNRAYACFQHATQSWVTSSVTSGVFDLVQGIDACQAMDSGSHKYTFWAPVTPSQNANAPQNVWLNIKYSAALSQWEVNPDATQWGKTVVWDKDGDGYNVNFRTVSEPNNGIFPAYNSKTPKLPENPNGENCATQQPSGYWYDVSCATALSFACFDPDTQLWALAPAGQNNGLYAGEAACKQKYPDHKYHFSAPSTRQQQVDLSNTAGEVAVWINATDRISESAWRYNQFLTFWAGQVGPNEAISSPQQPIADDTKDCAIADGNNAALWQAVSCSETHDFLCFDGSTWSVASGVMGANGIVSGQAACRTLSGSYDFSAPKTLAEQTAAASVVSNVQVWVNAFDSEIEGEWKVNQLRFWDVNEPNVANSVAEDCAVLKESNGRWVSDVCTGTNKAYLCFDVKNEKWKLSTLQGNLENFPQGQNACEAMNTLTEEYIFSAPNYPWENDSAVGLLAGAQEVWINGNDRILEGNWVFNQSLYWSGSALNTDPGTNDCLTINDKGYWQDSSCSDGPYKVACFSGDGWYLAPTTRRLSNFSDAQRACSEIGEGYRFFAPMTEEHNRDLRSLILAGEQVWINGIDIAEEGKWVFNSAGLPTPNWASNEPNGQTDNNCAYINDVGLWFDDACTTAVSSTRQLVCKQGSNPLFISNTSVVLNAENGFNNAHQACNSQVSGAVFYAPVTFNENEQLRQMMVPGTEVWANLSDDLIESRWALNIAKNALYQIVGTVAIDGCGTLSNAGNVTAESCDLEYPVACTDGQEWRVTSAKVALGSAATNGKLIRNAFEACQQEFSGDFTFAVPENDDQVSKWQLAQALALRGETNTWLNMADWFVATEFSANMPYQNIAVTPAQPDTGCAYVDGINGGWLIANQCDAHDAHFACSDGTSWQVAPADGTIAQPGTPQPMVDIWDQSYGDLRCKEFFGQAYSFAAPITPREDAELRRVVSRIENPVKDTWINFYANRLWTLNGQQWFNDRINLSVVDGVNLNQGTTTEDCGLLTKTAGKLELTDEICSGKHVALCFNGTDWKLPGAGHETQWNKASAKCGEQFDETHMFAIPRDSLERQKVLAALAEGQTVWVNYSDLAVESKWRANLPLRQWWANSEPTNLGNRDCVVMDGAGPATGEWRSDYCDQVFHSYACNRGDAWAIVDVDGSTLDNEGIWAQGFSACRSIPDDSNGPWQFAYPEDYFANLAAATSLTTNADLQTALAGAGKSAWLNLTDQYREKDWQRGRQFSNWAANFDFDDNRDCAYVDTTVTEINDKTVKGSWVPGLCHASDEARQYACTNGKNWVLADAGNNWSDGFDACSAVAPAGSWTFAAPNTAFDNERLKAAIGKGSAWINLQDVSADGDWAANLSKPNLPPIIKFVSAVGINVSPVQEQTAGLKLQMTVVDPEGAAISAVAVTEETGLVTVISTATPSCGTGCYEVTYSTPALTNRIKTLRFKFTATDNLGNSTFTYQEIEVLPPIVAWFNFDDKANPNFDITGNNNHANDNPEQPYDFPPVVNGELVMAEGTEVMTVPNLKTNTGSELSASYAVALRVRIDENDQLGYREFEIKFTGTQQCLDLPGSAASGVNVAMYACDGGADQKWYWDEVTGYIHNVQNDDFCLSHPGSTSLEGRNVELRECGVIKHPWNLSAGKIISGNHETFALHAASNANDTNVTLSALANAATWDTLTTHGRGILQRGENDAEAQPGLRLQDNFNYLEYAVTSVASGTQLTATTNEISKAQWVNLVLNVDSTTNAMTLFVDGIAQPSTPLPGGAATNTKALVIGAIPSAVRGFKGNVDEVQIFSRPLTTTEIEGVLPEPPVGFAQFEMPEFDIEEPQISAASLTMPVIIRRTDGNNGPMRAFISTEDDSASAPADYTALTNYEVVWGASDSVLRPTPEYGLLPLLSAISGGEVNSVEFNRNQPLFAAFDFAAPLTANPVGVLWEQGDINNGALVAFNDNHELIIRAGGDGASAARLVISAADVTTKLIGKTGSLLVEINPSINQVSAWFMNDGLLGSDEVISLGSNTAAGSFPNGSWSSGAQGRVGDISVISARYIRDRVNGSDKNGSAHWVEVEAYAVSNPGTNIALNKTVTAYDTSGAAIAPTQLALANIVDGDVASANYVDLGTGERIVQIDLGAVTNLDRLNIRHYYADNRFYNATSVEISEDGASWKPLFDSSVSGIYQETASGRTFNRMINEPAISTSVFANLSIARFYNQGAPSPLQRSVTNGKIIPLEVLNELGFDREPTERFKLNVVSVEQDTDGQGWKSHPAGLNGSNRSTEIRLLDYTKNTAGIFQFNVSDIECSEPHAGDNEGSMDLHDSTGRLYRSCDVQIQRRTGVVGVVQVSYGIDAGNITFTDDPSLSGSDLTDMVLDQKLTGGIGVLSFPQGVSVRSIGFRVLADKPSVYENNEKFRISLFNPVNITSPQLSPWLGDPVSVEVTVKDYAVGEIAMTSTNAILTEPLYSSDAGADNFEIRTVSVSRKNGSNGFAQVDVTAADNTATTADYQLVDELGNPQNPVTLQWLDGQSDSRPVYIKVFADKFQEYIDNVQTTDPAAACYDSNDADSKADDGARNCYVGESFVLTVSQNGGTTPVDAAKLTTTVYLADTTAPANVTMTASIADKAVVPERDGIAAIADVDNDGVYVEAKEGTVVPDNTMTVTVTRDNRYAEHAFYLDFNGIGSGSIVAASIGDNAGTRTTHDIRIPVASGAAPSAFEFKVDQVTAGSNDGRRYMLILAQDTSASETAQSVTLTVDILDNARLEAGDRQVDIQLAAAGDRDSAVVTYPGYPGANGLLRGFGISDVSLPPVFVSAPSSLALSYPKDVGSMAVGYSDTLSSIQALDQDWIDVSYQVNDGTQAVQSYPGKNPGWSFNDIASVWDYELSFNTATGYPYLSFIRPFIITAEDNEGETESINVDVTIKPRWMRITGFNDCVRETGGNVKDNGCTSDGASQWLAIPDKDVANAYRLINGWEGKCMTANAASNDANIVVATCTANNALQRWQFDASGSSIRLRQDDNDYKMCRIALTSGNLRIRTGGCSAGAEWTEWNSGNYVPR